MSLKTINKVKRIQFILQIFTLLIIAFISYTLCLYSDHVYYDSTYYVYNYINRIIPFIAISAIIAFAFMTLFYNNKNTSLYTYFQKTISHIHLSNESIQQAEHLFQKYVLLKTIFINLLLIIVISLMYFIIYDHTSLYYIDASQQWIHQYHTLTNILIFIIIILLLIAERIIIILIYKQKILPLFDQHPACFFYLFYLYTSLNKGTYNKLTYTYLFNMINALSLMNHYDLAYDALQFIRTHFKESLWKKPQLSLLYNFNSYIYLKRMNQDASSYYQQVITLCHNHPKVNPNNYITLRLELEELFSHQQWNEFIQTITSHQSQLKGYDLKPICQSQLYIAYQNIQDYDKAQQIQINNQDNALFQSYIQQYTSL